MDIKLVTRHVNNDVCDKIKTNLGGAGYLLPVFPYFMHSHAGAWEREKPLARSSCARYSGGRGRPPAETSRRRQLSSVTFDLINGIINETYFDYTTRRKYRKTDYWLHDRDQS